MSPLDQMGREQLADLAASLEQEYAGYQAQKLALNLTRGKPSAAQLSLSDDLDNALGGDYRAADGTDTRNYGGLRGLPEARKLGAELLGVPPDAVIAGGNSSLTLMHLVLETACDQGLWQDARRWRDAHPPKLLAPAPGYDRHFALSESLGIELVTIPMTPAGPDLAAAYELAERDAAIKGIWCVPRYSNPTGCIYSDDTVASLAELPARAAARDFVVLWDNAYAVHDFNPPGQPLASIAAAAADQGTTDHVVQFASTSKITFAGAGVAFVSASATVLASLERRMSFFTIGPDKVNQLRHARFLAGRLQEHMLGHAAILRPKFERVQKALDDGLGSYRIASWTRPEGGYFVSLDTEPGLARRVVALAQEAGLTLTPAGATFPYGNDPDDTNIRIAPTFADPDELEQALAILVVCVKLAAVKKRQEKRHE